MKLYLSLLHSCSVLCFLCLLARTGNRPAQKGLGSAHTCMQPGRQRPTTYLDITGTVVWGYCMGSSAVFLYSHTQKPQACLSFVSLQVTPCICGLSTWYLVFCSQDLTPIIFVHRCQPMLSKLYFVWVIPSGNDFEVSKQICMWREGGREGGGREGGSEGGKDRQMVEGVRDRWIEGGAVDRGREIA